MRVLLADDHLILLESLAALLEKKEGVQIVAKATNGLEALRIVEEVAVDIVVSDLNMPLLGGIEFTIRVKERFPHIKVILLTMVEDASQIREAIQAGACGYILKSASPDELRKALTEVSEGRRYFSRDIEKQLASIPNPHVPNGHEIVDGVPHLTKREIEVIRFIVHDFSSEAIAKQLNVSINTIETHRRNIFKKLRLNTVVGLVRFAIKHKLID
ncbi:response regulator [Runella sp. CRIBMP]|uniref:response regulator n=1 Tax=Runella sp. CRIBMP TaxID=2683261 RepID=UPI001411C04C|nr:response regulator transcription factor [Runella sp. CRIBMP]NBB21372.1 response regulator [Runella sp. CRIBMP]